MRISNSECPPFSIKLLQPVPKKKASSFFDQLDRFFEPDYTPTDSDIIHCRIKTTGKSIQ
jgi:hypothetical protein